MWSADGFKGGSTSRWLAGASTLRNTFCDACLLKRNAGNKRSQKKEGRACGAPNLFRGACEVRNVGSRRHRRLFSVFLSFKLTESGRSYEFERSNGSLRTCVAGWPEPSAAPPPLSCPPLLPRGGVLAADRAARAARARAGARSSDRRALRCCLSLRPACGPTPSPSPLRPAAAACFPWWSARATMRRTGGERRSPPAAPLNSLPQWMGAPAAALLSCPTTRLLC